MFSGVFWGHLGSSGVFWGLLGSPGHSDQSTKGDPPKTQKQQLTGRKMIFIAQLRHLIQVVIQLNLKEKKKEKLKIAMIGDQSRTSHMADQRFTNYAIVTCNN